MAISRSMGASFYQQMGSSGNQAVVGLKNFTYNEGTHYRFSSVFFEQVCKKGQTVDDAGKTGDRANTVYLILHWRYNGEKPGGHLWRAHQLTHHNSLVLR
ncbi:MAG: hypothetical protein Q7T82_19320, partial [Armatimonadota bacterium]|nr:hypothetical protein [Armatimonadota bacterium]